MGDVKSMSKLISVDSSDLNDVISDEAIPVEIYLPGRSARTRGYLINDLTYFDPAGSERIPNGTVVEIPDGTRHVLTGTGKIPVGTLIINGDAKNNPITLRAVQEQLNSLGYLGADGKPIDLAPARFGPNTFHAVNWFKDQNLPGGNRDEFHGVVGQTTLSALFSDTAPRANPDYRLGRGSADSSSGANSGDNVSVASGQVELIHVSEAARLVQTPGTLVPIECALSGTKFNLAVYSSWYVRHVDVVTASPADHEIVRSLFGFSWDPPHPVYATLSNGRICAGSIHTMPHGGGVMGDGTPGHVCLFFKGAGSDGDANWIQRMHAAIDTAWNLANKQGRAKV